MSWKANKPKSNSRRVQSTTDGIRWQPVVIVICCVVLGLPVMIVSLKAVKFIEESHALIILGIALACMLFGTITACYTAVMRSYSTLRNKEEALEDKHEMDMWRILAMMTGRGGRGTTINMPDQLGAGEGWGPDVGVPGQPAYQPPTIPYNEPVELQ